MIANIMENKTDNKPNFSKMEESILKFWEKEKIFEQSLEKTKDGKPFVFFEGPPTANGRPGIHHVLARAFKDVIPRYKTMRGYFVERKAGWDTHGLPVELQVEKELKISGKPQIEKYGVEKFNRKCKEDVWKYKTEWEQMTKRIGFWLDLEHPYITYENYYIESLWWIIKQVWDKGWLYQGHKVVPHCPRCGTALSSHEVAQGYEKISEESIYVKFKIKGDQGVLGDIKGYKGSVYILSWTTTPWTLPGNVALAVGDNIDYLMIEIEGNAYILAKDRLSVLTLPLGRKMNKEIDIHNLKDSKIKILRVFKGKDLVGLEYEPLFDIPSLKSKTSYKVYAADFVSTEDGTGVVHTAVMYGEDDYNLGEKVGLPKHHTVDESGRFTKEVKKWQGKFVKDVEKDITQDLKDRGLLYKTEMYEHDYPFCWRCESPLLYYAKDSWFIKMSGLREQLIKNNKTINWVPSYIKEGRFGEWLSEVKDWAFSRERYWGTPLPIWVCEKCGKKECIGSFKELWGKVTSTQTKYLKKAEIWIMRHGISTKNQPSVVQGQFKNNHKYTLTEEGKNQVKRTAKDLKGKIDIIISSDFLRTKETAEIVSKITGAKLIYDSDLREIYEPDWEGRLVQEVKDELGDEKVPFSLRLGGGENYYEVKERMQRAVKRALKDHPGKKILFISHGDPLWILKWSYSNIPEDKYFETPYPQKGTAEELVVPTEIDPHRPYVDKIKLRCSCGAAMKRVPEVVDVWFDSGSMPFAQWHYPFENKERVDEGKSFPADYIAEAIDQTRGWFYTLLAVSTLLGKGAPYKNVVCLGLLRDDKGEKMSKSKGNIIFPKDVIDQFGADAIRWYFFTMNQAGESKNFDLKGVEEVVKKNFLILWNVFSFYKMYAASDEPKNLETKELNNILDSWILAKLNLLIESLTKKLDKYQITDASREISSFINELSTWYLRRSRLRFKKEGEDKSQALATLHSCLTILSKLLAPFIPFLADHLYRELAKESLSVHLESWPKPNKKAISKSLIDKMAVVRKVVELGHALRKENNIKVRQPLAQFILQYSDLNQELIELIKDEMNVKEVILTKKLPSGREFVKKESTHLKVSLDLTITDELKMEGAVREMTRQINAMRKDAKLTIEDVVTLYYEINDAELKNIFENYCAKICETVIASRCQEGLIKDVDFKKILDVSGKKIIFGIKKNR